MESEDHFYLTLPSSASMDLHPNNKVSDFTTELIFPIQIERERYEIGLCEVILDVDVENVTSHQSAFVIFRSVKFIKEVLKKKNVKGLGIVNHGKDAFYWEEFTVKRGKYDSVDDVFGYFNSKFLRSRICDDLFFQVKKIPNTEYEFVTLKSILENKLKEKTFSFQKSPWMKKCIFIPNASYDGIKSDDPIIRSTLYTLMVFKPSVKEYLERGDVKSDAAFSTQLVCKTSDLFEAPGMAYIYSDIVDHQYVGNTKSPLLRVIHIPPGRKVITFPTVHYLPLSKAYLNSIRIYIRDVQGNPYPFTYGSALCKVHIRKKLQ